MGCLKLYTEPEYNALKAVFGDASKSSRGSGKNEVDTNYYYFGARYAVYPDRPVGSIGNPRTSTWLSAASPARSRGMDPLASKYPHASPYNYYLGNPIGRIDPTGMGDGDADDIRFNDADGNLIATYYTDEVDKDITIDQINIPIDLNININALIPSTNGLPDIDVIGINFGGEFTVGGGASINYQYAYFLEGKDAGEGAYFYSATGNLGLSFGAGISAFVGDFIGSKGDSKMTMNYYLGNAIAYNGGIGAVSGQYWWSNNLKVNQPEVYQGMGILYSSNYEQTWSGFSGGTAIGPPQLIGGLSFSSGTTKYLEWANRAFNLARFRKGYQK